MISLKQSDLGRRVPLASSPVTRILVPTDLTDDSQAAIWYGLGLARRARARLTLLHIWYSPEPAWPPPSPFYPAELELDAKRVLAECQQAEQTLRSIRNRIRTQHLFTEDCFLVGKPGPLILRAATDLGCDLIILSRNCYDWLSALPFGKTCEWIIRKAPCPVLVVSDFSPKPSYVRASPIRMQTTRLAEVSA